MYQKYGGIIWNAVILGIFIYLLLVSYGKITPKQEIEILKKNEKLLRILLWIGTIAFLAEIIIAIFKK
jgi:hypothetical protein